MWESEGQLSNLFYKGFERNKFFFAEIQVKGKSAIVSHSFVCFNNSLVIHPKYSISKIVGLELAVRDNYLFFRTFPGGVVVNSLHLFGRKKNAEISGSQEMKNGQNKQCKKDTYSGIFYIL